MNHPEHNEQVALFRWAALQENIWPELRTMFAVPNSARRSPRQGAWMKAEGLRAGVWDIFLPAPVQKYHGLFIEMKTGKNKLTIEQEYFRKMLCGHYEFIVCYSAQEAINAITLYLSGDRF